ncbi:MAG: 2-C-methyl-D-erythritol 4-phosphate cytidylyltransferase [Candidatus Gastranaerophilales bacterium]|nr:2-C-methyl-D-erythritol 4-phosphate cytidylyltransferase [Candidatus Gastranaerophilales bacterium]
MKITAIIPAAGSGSRYSSNKNKLLENLDGLPVLVRTLKVIASVQEINNIIICTSEDLIAEINTIIKNFNIEKVSKVILGGKTRQESVFNGLKAASEFNPDLVLIHDGARPLVTEEIIKNAIECAKSKGTAIVAVQAKDTIKRVNISTNQIIETLDRELLWNIQTPQIFKYNELLEAHRKFEGMNLTDDSALIEKLDLPAFVVMGSYSNIKITTKEDLLYAEMLLKN